MMNGIRSLGLSEQQISVVMEVRKKGKNLTHALQHRNRKDAMMEKLKVTFDRVTFLKLIISWQEDVENMKRTLEANQEMERKKREELASCRSYYNEGGFKYDY